MDLAPPNITYSDYVVYLKILGAFNIRGGVGAFVMVQSGPQVLRYLNFRRRTCNLN